MTATSAPPPTVTSTAAPAVTAVAGPPPTAPFGPPPSVPPAQAPAYGPGPGPGAVPGPGAGRLAAWWRAALPDLPSAKAVALDTLAALGSQYALVLVLVTVGVCFLPGGHHGNLVDWLTSAAMFAGLALRGTLSLSVAASTGSDAFGSSDLGSDYDSDYDYDGGYDSGYGSGVAGAGDLGLTFQPLLLTCTALLAVWWFARRREALSPAPTPARAVGRSATAALIHTAAMSLLVTVAHAGSGYGLDTDDDGLPVSLDLGVGVWPMLVHAFVLVFLADWAARSRHRLRQAVRSTSARWADWWAAATTAVSATVALLAAAFLASFVYLVVGDTGDLGFGRSLAIALFAAPNVAILLGGAMMGATLGSSADGSVSTQLGYGSSGAPALRSSEEAGLLHGGTPAASYLLLLVTALVFVLFAVRHAFGRDPRERTWKAMRVAVVMAALWGVLAWLSTVSASSSGSLRLEVLLSASGDARIDASAGLLEPSSILVALGWGALIALATRFLARPLAGTFPRAAARLTRLPGQPVHPQWAALLGDALDRAGRPTPARLLPSLTEPLANPPLSVSPRRARVITAALGIVVLLGVGGYAADKVIADKVYGPQNVAEDYLNALSEGHAADALAHLADAPSAGPLLGDAALGAQLKAAPLTGVKVEDVDVDDDRATVSVSYSVGGRPQTADLSMVADDEDEHFGLWPRWKVSDGLAHIEVTAPSALSGVRVNGQQVPAPDGATGDLAVFPGAVTAGGAAGSSLLEVGGDSLLTVEPGADAGASATLTLTLTSAGEESVRQAARDALTSCLSAATELEPMDCPVSYYTWDEVSDVKWSLASEPETYVEVDDYTGDITVEGAFDAAVTYRLTESADSADSADGSESGDSPQEDQPETDPETDTYTFTGSVDFTDGKPTVSLDG
ncbi:hypothetical protein [Streptomyces sp. NPDC003401]